MISRRVRPFAVALVSTIFLAACSSSPETGSTGAGGAASSTTVSTTGAGGSGGASTTSSATSSSSATTTTTSSSTGTGGAGGAAICADALVVTLANETTGLLYLSESDYPFETVNVKDTQSTGAITPAHLVQLLALDPASTVETRTLDMFFANLLAGDDAAKYQIILDTLKSNLTDLTVIRVIPPAPNSAQVHVYVVGRTGCGEIAGLTTISIET